MLKIEWPVDKCEACGFDLREATPKAAEKSNDANGKLKWTDFCPKCGHGYFVGDRTLPQPTAEEAALKAAQPVIGKPDLKLDESVDPEHQVTGGKPATSKPSGVPPDKRGADLAKITDPEKLLNAEVGGEAEPEVTPEKGQPREGEYWCTKCASIHRETSKVGQRHKKYAESWRTL